MQAKKVTMSKDSVGSTVPGNIGQLFQADQRVQKTKNGRGGFWKVRNILLFGKFRFVHQL